MLCTEIEEKAKKVDREVLYLLNKLRSYPKPKPKSKNRADNTTTANGSAKSYTDNTTAKSPADDAPTILEDESDKGDKEPATEGIPTESSDPLGLLLAKLNTRIEAVLL